MNEHPTRRQLRLMRQMREGHDLREETKSKAAIAMLGNLREIEMSQVEEIFAAGWIYEVGSPGKGRVWTLTMKGLEVLARNR